MRVLLLLANTLLILSLAVRQGDGRSSRAAYSFRAATWNMRGAGKTKWQQLATLLGDPKPKNTFEVVALQECGKKPKDAKKMERKKLTCTLWRHEDTEGKLDHIHLANDKHNVKEYKWAVGKKWFGKREKHFIYQWELLKNKHGVKSARNNMAIVSRQRADEIIIFSDGGWKRPILGIRVGTAYFFSIHASVSGGTKNVAAMIKRLEQDLRDEPKKPTWLIMGDFKTDLIKKNLLSNTGTRKILQIPDRAPTRENKVLNYAVLGSYKALPRKPKPLMETDYMMDGDDDVPQSEQAAVKFMPK